MPGDLSALMRVSCSERTRGNDGRQAHRLFPERSTGGRSVRQNVSAGHTE